MPKLFTIILLAGTCLMPSVIQKEIIYVKKGGTGNGSSWGDALGDLQTALQVSAPGGEIWVAEGIYTPIKCTQCTEKDRAISFGIPPGVKVIGGFKGREKGLMQRKWRKHPTILSGNIGRSGSSDNSYTVVTLKGGDKTTMLDGLIISDGQADALMPLRHPHRSGGGLYNEGEGAYSQPMLVNCLFINNYAREGGAIYNYGGRGNASPFISDCTFTNNRAVHGGAIFNDGEYGNSCPNVSYTQFVNNEADYGAGVFSISPQPDAFVKIFNSTFANNKSDHGGCLFYLGLSDAPSLKTVLFINNISGDDTKGNVTVKWRDDNRDGWMVETYLEEDIKE